jgi:hypothetical protein
MKIAGRFLTTAMAVTALLSFAPVNQSYAELRAVGPIDGDNGFPVWFQDTNNVALEACLDLLDPFCLQPIPAPNPSQPVSFPGNFPEEVFWWTGDATIPLATGGTASLILAMEGAFANAAVIQGDQVTFGRIRIGMDAPVVGTYIFTHPFGTLVTQAVADNQGRISIQNAGVDVGLGGAPFTGVIDPANNDTETINSLDTYNFGPYLRWTDPDFPVVDQVSGRRYMGNPNIPHAVTGSPLGNNFFRVQGPVGSNIGGLGIDTVQTELFTVSGKILGLGVTPFPAASATAVVGTPVNIPVTVTNLTSAAVSFVNTPIAVTGTNAADFTVLVAGNTCTGVTLVAPDPTAIPPVAAGACTFNVQFSPAATATATRTATVTVTSDNPATAPSVSVALTGTAKYTVSPIVSANGTVTMKVNTGAAAAATAQDVNAGSTVEFTITPTNTLTTSYLPRVLDNTTLVAPVANKVTLNSLAAHHTVDVKFLRAGKLTVGGTDTLVAGDALRALQIALGVGVIATEDELVAADVGPLLANKPKSDGSVDVSDVMLILRRAVGIDPVW